MEEEVKQYLHIRYQWKGQPIIDADYLLDLYFRANYYPTDKLIDFLCYFYGYKITFPQSDVDFQVEKVLKDYPYKYLHPVLTKKAIGYFHCSICRNIYRSHGISLR